MTNFTRDEQFTLMTLWSIFKSPLMFGGNFPDNDAFTDSLITNKNMLYVLNKSINNKQLFRNEKQVAWIADDPANGDKFLAVFNIEDREEMIESKAIWKSEIINRQRPLEPIDIKLNGSRKLYLAVSAGENIDWDHANWINPVLHKGNDTISLTSLKWVKATSGWGKARVNKSVSGGDLIVDGKKYEQGLGVHANSVIEYEIPEGVDRFTAMAGLDKAGADQNVGATVRFLVFTEQPSGPEPAASSTIKINLSDLGWRSARAQDMWSVKPMGVYEDVFSVTINKHGAGLYRLTGVKKK
jgi:hypothetical protein